MADELKINDSTIRLTIGDVTDLAIESFVYYAKHDLALGSGFGTAISIRGGPSIQEELKQYGTLQTGEAVVSSAGDMKAKYIIHAVGPRFQEEEIDRKLRETMRNVLKAAEDKGITAIAFPAMGVGFYGVPLPVSAQAMLETIREQLSGSTAIKEVVVCLLDNREYKPFQSQLSALTNPQGVTA
jgi:O-acetyl-ADP-ribose deacetylase (regulator of RNase III)